VTMTVTDDDMVMIRKLGYFGEAESKLVRFAGEEIIPKPKEDEVVVFKRFFRARLRSPLNDMIGEVLKNFEIYLHQLTPNAIVRLSVLYGLCEARVWMLMSKLFVGYMNCIIRRRPGQMVFIRTSAATTLLIEKIQRLQ
jgi:hypothetical protein